MLRCVHGKRNPYHPCWKGIHNNELLKKTSFKNFATRVRDENMTEFEQIIDLCSRRGFVFKSSELYGGLAATYDYGPLGVEMKNNIKNLWWRDFIHRRKDCVGIDTPIIMHPEIWKTAGHVDNFVDPIVICQKCNKHLRADKLIEQSDQHQKYHDNENLSLEKLQEIFQEHPPSCNCGVKNPSTEYSPVQTFNMLFETYYGPKQSLSSKVFLRPETAQGIFVNFRHVVDRMRKKLPLGIGQIGKAFRNEIAPRDFLFRTREFEQMELEYFCHPQESETAFDSWLSQCYDWACRYGLNPNNLRIQRFDRDVAHYAQSAADIEYRYPFGWQEMWGVANRTDYDLTRHSKQSKKSLEYRDPTTNERYTPYCVEPSVGLDRLFLAFIIDAYSLETVQQDKNSDKSEQRAILKLNPSIAPYRCAIMPLVKKESIADKASQVFESLLDAGLSCDYDDAGSIGKRYRRQDEIGTPASITVDYQTLDDDTVTVRDRDTMEQKRVLISQIKDELL